MINKLQRFIEKYLPEDNTDETPLEHRLQLASAALMVEVIHVDEQVTDIEQNKIRQLISERFELDDEEIDSLIELAHDEKHEATDYFVFTSLLNSHYSQQQKISLIEDLWRIAYADDELDKYEEHLIRRLSELLHVPHQEFIKSKHKVSEIG
jgi:uncharacterized tellurite resistance protein B-like protein